MDTPLIALTGRKRSGKDTAAAHLIGAHGYRRVAFADPIKKILEAMDPYIDGERATGGYTTVPEQAKLMDSLRSHLTMNLGLRVTPERLARSMGALDPYVTGRTRLCDLLLLARRESEHTGQNPWDLLKEGSDLIIGSQAAEIRRLQQVLGTEAVREVYGDSTWTDAGIHNASALRGQGHPVVITDCRFDNEARAVREAGGIVVRIERPDLPAALDTHASEAGVSDDLVDLTIVNDGSIEDLHECIEATIAQLREDSRPQGVIG